MWMLPSKINAPSFWHLMGLTSISLSFYPKVKPVHQHVPLTHMEPPTP